MGGGRGREERWGEVVGLDEDNSLMRFIVGYTVGRGSLISISQTDNC